MEIHQLLVGAAYGDAITNEALRLRGLLRQVAASEIFAVYRDERLPDVLPWDELPHHGDPSAVLIAYLSIGEASFYRFLRSRRERIVLRYHSMTPPDEVRAYDARYAQLLEEGQSQITAMAHRTALGLAGSRFGELELIARGFPQTATCPLLVSVDTLLSITPRAPLGIPADDRPVVLFVGRIVPNKAVEDVLVAFHVLKTYRMPDAHLVLVGGPQFSAYQSMLRELMTDLGLDGVTFTGRIDAAELAGVYRRASVLLCVSRHEGFCAPLVEAMAFEVPIVATQGSAIDETLGGSGWLLRDRSPTIVAEALATMITDRRVRDLVVSRQRRRLGDFDPERVGAAWLRHISAVV